VIGFPIHVSRSNGRSLPTTSALHLQNDQDRGARWRPLRAMRRHLLSGLLLDSSLLKGQPPQSSFSVTLGQYQLALVSTACEGVRQVLVCVSAAATGAFVFSGATVYLHGYSLRCEPSSQLSYSLSPPLKFIVQVPAPFQLPSGMYSYFPTQSLLDFGTAGSSGMDTHRPAKSTNLCPFSGSDSLPTKITPVSRRLHGARLRTSSQCR